MSLLKAETPSTPDIIEDELETRRDELPPVRPKRMTPKKEDITSIGRMMSKLTGNTSRRYRPNIKDWEEESIAMEVDEDPSKDINA